MHLVKQDDAIGNAMQLAASGRTVGEQRFKELDRTGDNYWRVPVFGEETLVSATTIPNHWQTLIGGIYLH